MELDQLIEKVTVELMKEFKREPQDLQGLQSSPASQTACASQEIARFIDHTLLKPDSTREQIIRFCEEAKEYCFASVCVNPTNVSLASNLLKDLSLIHI